MNKVTYLEDNVINRYLATKFEGLEIEPYKEPKHKYPPEFRIITGDMEFIPGRVYHSTDWDFDPGKNTDGMKLPDEWRPKIIGYQFIGEDKVYHASDTYDMYEFHKRCGDGNWSYKCGW